MTEKSREEFAIQAPNGQVLARARYLDIGGMHVTTDVDSEVLTYTTRESAEAELNQQRYHLKKLGVDNTDGYKVVSRTIVKQISEWT